MEKAPEKKEVERGESQKISEGERCTHVFPDGRRCKQRRWREKELCFHHAPEAAELRQNAGRPRSAIKILTATEVNQPLAETLEKVKAGKLEAGQAYAVGYLAQLILGNLAQVGKEYDWVKSEWERYHREIYSRVRALDEGTYQAQEAEEAEEAKEAGKKGNP